MLLFIFCDRCESPAAVPETSSRPEAPEPDGVPPTASAAEGERTPETSADRGGSVEYEAGRGTTETQGAVRGSAPQGSRRTSKHLDPAHLLFSAKGERGSEEVESTDETISYGEKNLISGPKLSAKCTVPLNILEFLYPFRSILR